MNSVLLLFPVVMLIVRSFCFLSVFFSITSLVFTFVEKRHEKRKKQRKNLKCKHPTERQRILCVCVCNNNRPSCSCCLKFIHKNSSCVRRQHQCAPLNRLDRFVSYFLPLNANEQHHDHDDNDDRSFYCCFVFVCILSCSFIACNTINARFQRVW